MKHSLHMGGLLIKSLHYFSSSQLTCNFRSTVVPVWPSWTFLGLSSKQESGHIASQFIPISNHTGNQGNPGQYILGIEYTFIEDPLFRLLWPLIIHDITCLYHLSMSAKRTAQKDQEKRTHTHTHTYAMEMDLPLRRFGSPRRAGPPCSSAARSS